MPFSLVLLINFFLVPSTTEIYNISNLPKIMFCPNTLTPHKHAQHINICYKFQELKKLSWRVKLRKKIANV